MLEDLEVDVERMRVNLGDAEPDLGAAGELIDRALLAHRGVADEVGRGDERSEADR
jgi:hypothetical protein